VNCDRHGAHLEPADYQFKQLFLELFDERLPHSNGKRELPTMLAAVRRAFALPTFPSYKDNGFLRRPLAAVKGAPSFVRSSETLDGEDGPRTLVSEGKGGGSW